MSSRQLCIPTLPNSEFQVRKDKKILKSVILPIKCKNPHRNFFSARAFFYSEIRKIKFQRRIADVRKRQPTSEKKFFQKVLLKFGKSGSRDA